MREADDTMSLRERIAQPLNDAFLVQLIYPEISKGLGITSVPWAQDMRRSLCDAILPVVEQAIQQEREKIEDGVFAALAKQTVEDDDRVAALAEKDAQIAALQAKIDDAQGPWWASELASEGYDAKQEVKRLQAALEQFSEWLTVRDNMWMERAHHNRHGEGDVWDEHHGELVDVRARFDDVLDALRQTPAPPQEPRS